MAEESWIALATGSNSEWVYAYLGRAPTKGRAESKVMENCRAEGFACTFLKSWRRGCIYAVSGHDASGRAYLGTGPDLESATQQCEATGASCSDPDPASMCVLETDSPGVGDIAGPMAQLPGTTRPTPNYRPEPADVMGADSLVRYFTWMYNFEPEPGLRTWSRDDLNRWSERYPSGRVAKVFDTVEASSVGGCNGQLVSRSTDPSFQVFIPNKGCKNMVAKFRRGDDPWSNLGKMEDVE
ncbi:hypothetical protein ACO2RV_00440 [Ancylobacter sp. VNQ12]|uniref:hypothetical protein n=1 Tax=Ancylobacter sp. VNQ12 TaxID=3400920 RepID=UPI003BFC815A